MQTVTEADGELSETAHAGSATNPGPNSSAGACTPVKRPRVSSLEEIARGAEGVVSRVPFLGRQAVMKERFPKPYRHPELDRKLTTRRLAQEARTLLRLRKAGIRVPAVYLLDLDRATIVLEDMKGVTLRAYLATSSMEDAQLVISNAARAVRKMHDVGVIHGDLTTSNMLVCETNRPNMEASVTEIVLIDFGLSSNSDTEEDKAVDLYVLERAVVSAHPERAENLNATFLTAYAAGFNDGDTKLTLSRLEDVRSRGRKRDMTG